MSVPNFTFTFSQKGHFSCDFEFRSVTLANEPRQTEHEPPHHIGRKVVHAQQKRHTYKHVSGWTDCSSWTAN